MHYPEDNGIRRLARARSTPVRGFSVTLSQIHLLSENSNPPIVEYRYQSAIGI